MRPPTLTGRKHCVFLNVIETEHLRWPARSRPHVVRTLSQVRQRFQVHVWSSPFYFLALTLRPHHEGLEEAVRSIGISLGCFIHWGKEGLVEGGNLDVAWNICIYNVPPKKAFRQARKETRTSLEDCPVAFSAHFSASSCPVLLAFLCPQGQCVSGMFLALNVHRRGQWLSGNI